MLATPEQLPYERDAQRSLTRVWARMVEGQADATGARALIRESWARSAATIRPDLSLAPVVLDDDLLAAERDRADWLSLAFRAADRLSAALSEGHILSLFDARGQMLACEGDGRAREGLARINFRPGALWTEGAIGTNGPGTALQTESAVHIVGAEHFCEALHDWHCAAVPLRDEVTGSILGVIDVSGFRRYAHPHSFELALALASSVQQMLTFRESERRYAVLHRFAELSATHSHDTLVAVDRGGRVLFASPATPAGLRPGSATPLALRTAMADHVRSTTPADNGQEVFLSLHEDMGITALSHLVMDGNTPVGACLVVRGSPGASGQSGARSRVVSPAVAGVTRYSFADVIGDAGSLREAVRIARAASRNTLPVLLSGESGTGKEVFAQAIHDASSRRTQPFVAVNCGALPRELVETELFGYVGGAFTGARREGHHGKFLAANHGTIFLDEISELPAAAQASLLRILQEHEITPIGSAQSKTLDVRVIAATNRDVAEAVATGRLRSDLYFRLNVLPIDLPPLRARRDDIAALARHFLALAMVEVERGGFTFDDDVVEKFEAYDWPGNVRELKNLVRRLVALATTSRLTVDQLPDTMLHRGAPALSGESDVDFIRGETLAALESAPTVVQAAERLGINRSTLYRRLDQYGLRPKRSLRAR
ncbi:MAG: sigma-54-dependent Fis family transcriptional regulator [bacterium]